MARDVCFHQARIFVSDIKDDSESNPLLLILKENFNFNLKVAKWISWQFLLWLLRRECKNLLKLRCYLQSSEKSFFVTTNLHGLLVACILHYLKVPGSKPV